MLDFLSSFFQDTSTDRPPGGKNSSYYSAPRRVSDEKCYNCWPLVHILRGCVFCSQQAPLPSINCPLALLIEFRMQSIEVVRVGEILNEEKKLLCVAVYKQE